MSDIVYCPRVNCQSPVIPVIKFNVLVFYILVFEYFLENKNYFRKIRSLSVMLLVVITLFVPYVVKAIME